MLAKMLSHKTIVPLMVVALVAGALAASIDDHGDEGGAAKPQAGMPMPDESQHCEYCQVAIQVLQARAPIEDAKRHLASLCESFKSQQMADDCKQLVTKETEQFLKQTPVEICQYFTLCPN